MYGGTNKYRACFNECVAWLLLVATCIALFEPFLFFEGIPKAEAAQVTVDATAQPTGSSHLKSGPSVVFTDDQTGYKFFRDAVGYCVYRKTTDGGATWSSTTTVDAQTDCHQISIWYDKWTPGSASSSIHIATIDASSDDIWYNRLDTAGDTLLLGSSPVSMLTGTGQGGTSLTAGENFVSITRATNGTIYAVSNDGSGTNDSFILECTSSCNLAASWTETAPNPLDVQSDQNVLVPLTDGDIMIIQRDISADDIRTRIWDDSAGSWLAWVTVDPNATDNTTYDVGIAAVVSTTTPGAVYIAYIADYATLGTDDDVRVGYYNGTTWSTSSPNVISNSATRAVTGVAIGLDAASNDVYVAYTARTTAGTANTGNLYWKMSTSTMSTWSTEQGPVNTAADDLYGPDINMANDQRIHVSWFDGTDDDIYADTIVDIFPGVHASTSGTQVRSLLSGTTSAYVGGKFFIYNNYARKSFDVTSITVTESGTVDAENALTNIRLLYEMDTTAPYNCASVSYDGTEDPFGSTDTNGFSGANGVSSFIGTTVTLSTTTAFCGYVVLDVLDAALSSSTIDVSLANPSTDVVVTDSTAGPTTQISIASSTIIYNDTPTLTHYHWRNDDGGEATSTSKTSGVADTSLTAFQVGSPARLRFQVSNEGSTSTGPMQYRLEYGTTSSVCASTSVWAQVGNGEDIEMYNSSNLTDGTNTTNIATALGGMTDENTTFLTPNAGVKDTSSQTNAINLTPSQFVELEYSIVATTTAVEGDTYCFRVTNAGTALASYSQLARANIAADVLVTIATSTSQVTSTTTPVTNFYVGSYFAVTENTSSRNVTSITIKENGTVDGETGLDNIRLRYDLDTSSPYNCVSESYSASDTAFGTTDTDGFSGPNGTSTFTGSVTISTTSTMCLYVVVDSTSLPSNGETIDIVMESPSSNLIVTGGGSVSPSVTRDMNGSTTLVGPVVTQTHYHWRSDNGSETTASSSSNGNQDTPITNVAVTTPVRLRMQISNEGGVTTTPTAYRMEYGAKISTCSAVSAWTDVGETGGAWDMYNSANLTEGGNTTNIATPSGGVADENTTFISSNAAVKETSSVIATTTISGSQFLETEYSMIQTSSAGYDITYCFRLARPDGALNVYTTYAELTTSPERDFEIQRGTVTFNSTSTTLVAGVNYTAPSASTSAFVRITNTAHTGAGGSSPVATQNADDVTAYILDPSNIMTSFTIQRPTTTAATNTRVSYEIVEFIGTPGSDNEMIVRGQGWIRFDRTATIATGTTLSTITDDSDVVVFITGIGHPDTLATNYNSMLTTSEWNGTANAPVFRRGVTGSDGTFVSYAVVEFTGQNWKVQRSEHTYSSAGTTETEAITALGSLSRAFIHTQKRVNTGLTGVDEFGHEVWLSSIGFVSYFLEAGATTPTGQTSVAWIIENTQTSAGAMDVTRPPQRTSNGGTAPLVVSESIGKTLTDITNASLFVNSRSAGTGTNYPRPIAGATIASTTHYELWRSNTGANLTFRAEIVEWPTAGLAYRQNYYRFYIDNNALTPADAWPEGGVDIGENTVISAADDPLGERDRLRLRMSIEAMNSTFPTTTAAFKLQYAPLTTTCSAVAESSWTTLGNSASSTVWRGFSATGTTDGTVLGSNPPLGGELLLSVSDIPGTLEEENNSEPNPYGVPEGSDVEYDWIIEQNGAAAETYYCFRMVETDGTLLGSYAQYPQIRTASFTPRSQDWRWYDDETSLTPVTPLAGTNVTPVDIANDDTFVLRITVKETKNIARDDVRFKLQFSEYADFSTSTDVVASSSCIATSTWCYADGGGVDNAVISTTTLSDPDACVSGIGDGCGTYNESPASLTGFRHENGAASEYSFTIQSAYPRVNTVYYFRLYDLNQDTGVPPNDGETYPSVVTEGASLTFTMTGLGTSTVIEGITTDINTSPTAVPYGLLTINADIEAAQRLSVTTDAPEGYQIYMMSPGELMSAGGSTIDPVSATNLSPAAWNTACGPTAQGCFGYHTGDDTLEGGSTRFAANDTYARFSTTTLDEVVYVGGPVVNETVDMVYKIKARSLQEAGQYETGIRFISVPIF